MPQEGHKAEACSEHKTQKIPREAIHRGNFVLLPSHTWSRDGEGWPASHCSQWVGSCNLCQLSGSKEKSGKKWRKTVWVQTVSWKWSQQKKKKDWDRAVWGQKENKQSIVGKGEQTTSTKMERKRAWLRKKKNSWSCAYISRSLVVMWWNKARKVWMWVNIDKHIQSKNKVNNYNSKQAYRKCNSRINAMLLAIFWAALLFYGQSG